MDTRQARKTGWPGWYTRDASWWRKPNVTEPKKYHLSDKNGMARCGMQVVLDAYSVMVEVPELRKCKRCLAIKDKTQ